MRVRDWRLGRLQTMANVDIYLESPLDADQVLEFAFPRVVLATGAHWLPALLDERLVPIEPSGGGNVLTPTEVLTGADIVDPVVIYDFEHYVTGGCLAELLAERGHKVTFVTPGDEVSGWARNTHDQFHAQSRLIDLNVTLGLAHFAVDYDGSAVKLRCKYSGRERTEAAGTLVAVGARRPEDSLFQDLQARESDQLAAGIRSLQRIGDCDVPGAVVHAVYAGHKLAREFDTRTNEAEPTKLERAQLSI